jgi:predicted alpha/beta-hydrolase family hydrolase
MEVALPTGAVEVSTSLDKALDPWAVMALAHGAGAGMDHPFLLGLAAACARQGVSVMRFAFPYAQAGRKMPGPASHAIATWAAVEAAARQAVAGVPFVAAGKSYGGRMASMAAAGGAIAPAALVYLGYPLHPPGAPEKLRADHLPQITVAQLFVEGTNDPFIQPRRSTIRPSADAETPAPCGSTAHPLLRGQGPPPTRRPDRCRARGFDRPVAASALLNALSW